MSNIHEVQPLPPARTLDRRQQLRIVGIAALVLLAVFVVIGIVQRLTAPAEVVAKPQQPGTFQPTPDQLRQLKVETVRDGVDAGHIDATGTISVDEDHSTPVLLPFSGQVAEVFVQAGQRVSRGQPLLRVASPDFVEARNTLSAATAARATAEAQLKIATDTAKRQQAIYETAGGALKDYRQSQSDLVTAQSAVQSSSAALAAAQAKLGLIGHGSVSGGNGSQTTYSAPVSGVIATRDVAPGQYVGAGGDKPLMTIADFSHVWLVAQLAEGDAASVHVGDRVEVTTPAYPGRTFHAVIDNVAAALDPATHRLPVRATVANPDLALKPQMFATFQIQRPGAKGQAILVPSNAVIHEGDTARVWLLGRDGLLRAQPVTVVDSENGFDKIAAGLKPGDRIVTAGALFVNEAGLGG